MNIEQLNARIDQLGAGEVLRLDGIDEHIYHASKGYGSTAIKKMALGCPALFHHYINQPQKPPTEAMEIGSAIHCEILTPFDVDDLFVYQPEELTRRGNAWKDFKALHSGKTILRANARETVKGCSDSVLERFEYLFSSGCAELSYWKRDEEFPSVILKSRLDYELDDQIVDLKTTVSVSPEHFSRDFLKYGYHIQSAMYKFVADKTDFIFCAVEKEPPYMCGIFESDEGTDRLGFLQFRKAIAMIDHCQNKTGFWPSYTNQKTIVSLPPWKQYELEKLESELD